VKAKYRGHTIEVNGVGELLYYSVFRDSDGYECLNDFEGSAESAASKMRDLKRRVDMELLNEHPWGEDEEPPKDEWARLARHYGVRI
jgi:hypothetical protein